MILHCLQCSAPWDADGLVPGERFHCGCGAEQLVPGAEDAPAGPLGCPRCGPARELEPFHPEWALVAGCPRCEGLLLPVGAIQKLVGDEGVRHQFLKELPAARWASRRRVASRLEEATACPACGLAMTRHTFAGSDVVIDSCHTHGSWFDPDELRQALEVCESGAQFREDMEREARPTWGKFTREQAALDEERASQTRGALGGLPGGAGVNVLLSLLRWF